MSIDPRDSVANNYRQAYGYGSGMPPPPGYGRGGRGGMPVWARVLVIVLVIILGGCGAIIGFTYYTLRNAGLVADVPKAKVVTGTAVQWTELHKWKGGGIFNPGGGFGGPGIYAGNFDSDADPELLLSRPPNMMATAMSTSSKPQNSVDMWVFELNGGQRKLTLPVSPYLVSADAWDYDHDGVLEIVVWSGGTEVYDVKGRFVATLSGNYNYPPGQYAVDVDGDGFTELLLSDPLNSGNVVATGLRGKAVWTTGMQTFGGTWGNIDGDKYAEYIDPYGGSGGGAQGLDMKGQATALPNLPQQSTLNSGSSGVFDLLCTADINGDKLDEVILPFDGYLDPKSGKFVKFARPIKPASQSQSYMPGQMYSRAVAGDFDGDGTRELAVTDTGGRASFTNMSIGSAVIIYRADGSVQYYEEFGRSLLGLTSLRDGKRDRLAVLLDNALLLAP